MTVTLAQQHCQAYGPGTLPLSSAEVGLKLHELPGWKLERDGKRITREYVMKDFDAGVALMGRIAPVANAEDHHPDMHLVGYRRLQIELSTHSVGGLSMNDFILAAKIEALPKDLQ